MPTSRYERAARKAGFRVIAGLDEAGRGSPVRADGSPGRSCARSGAPHSRTGRQQGSRTRSPRSFGGADSRARPGVGGGGADVFEIDRINIYQASLLAMKRALDQLTAQCDYLLLDAVKLPVPVAQKSAIRRCLSFSIAAASILAKVSTTRLWSLGTAFFRNTVCAATRAIRRPTTSPLSIGMGRHSCTGLASNLSARRARDEWTGYPMLRPNPDQGELFACP